MTKQWAAIWLSAMFWIGLTSPSVEAQNLSDSTLKITSVPQDEHIQEQARHHFYRSKRFWIPLAIGVASMAFDYRSSQQGIARGAVETNPIFGSHRPGTARMIAIGMPIETGFSFVGYRMSESRHRYIRVFWLAPEAWDVYGHVSAVVHNDCYGGHC